MVCWGRTGVMYIDNISNNYDLQFVNHDPWFMDFNDKYMKFCIRPFKSESLIQRLPKIHITRISKTFRADLFESQNIQVSLS